MGLFIGRKFKIISNGTVSHAEIIDIEDKYVIVLIDGKRFKMDKKTLIQKFSDHETEKNMEAKRICENCMDYKNGNCSGMFHICDDFRLAPEISKMKWKDGQNMEVYQDQKAINI